MSVMQNAFRTPEWNGYGVTNDDTAQVRTMEKRGLKKNPVMNAFSEVMKFGAPEAFERGRQQKLKGQLGDALKSEDYGSASNLLIDMGQYEAGMGMRDQQAQMAKQAQRGKIEGIMSFTENLMQIPEQQRAQFIEQNFAEIGPIVGENDFYTFWQKTGGDISDAALAEDLTLARTQLGMGAPEGDEAYTLAPGARRFEGDQMVAENPKEVMPQGPASAIGKIMADVQSGLITPEQGQAAIERANAPRGPLSVTNINPSAEEYAESLLDPPQTKGKDKALVWDESGRVRVSPNAQQKGLNQQALKFNDLAAKRELVQDDISRALDLFTDIDPETGIRTVREGQMVVGPSAAIADIPVFGNSTKAGSMEGMLTTIKANVGFDELQAMREASPTGGALGQVSEQEIAFLQALLGDLEQSRDPKIFMYNMERLDAFLEGRQARFKAAFEADYPSAEESIGRESEARSTVQALVNKYAEE